MSSLRPDGRPPGGPLHTPSDETTKPAPKGAPKAQPAPAEAATDKVAIPGPGHGEKLTRTSSESLRLKKPESSQYVGAKSVPVTGTVKKAATAQAPAAQKRTADALIAASQGKADAAAQALCQQLMGMTLKPEGFKTLVAARPGADWHGLMCHEPAQLQLTKGEDHVKLAANLSVAYSSSDAMQLVGATPEEQKKASIGLRNELFKGSMSPKSDGSCGVKGLHFAGTRLCQEGGAYVLSPSVRYHFNAEALGDVALLAVARAHAGLLMGAGIGQESIVCHPDHPKMQVLVDAIRAQMTAGQA